MAAVFPLLLLAGCLLPALPTHAADAAAKPKPDVLVFSNGDTLTGKLDHEAGGTVFFSSDNAGMVQVPWSKLKELRTEKQFAVIETGSPVGRKKANLDIPIGTISIEGDTLTVNTLHGSQQIPVKNIAYIIDQATFEKNVFKKQGLTQGITGTVSAGASTVNSTQNSVSINSSVVLSRVVPPVTWMPARQRTLLNFNSNYRKIESFSAACEGRERSIRPIRLRAADTFQASPSSRQNVQPTPTGFPCLDRRPQAACAANHPNKVAP